jgi:hypothetical protein
MAISTSAEAQVAICATPTSASDETALAALTYVPVGKVQSLGEIGPQAQDVSAVFLSGEPVQHLKGVTDNGVTTITCGRDPLDAGQLALKAASLTKFEYALRITLADAADANDSDSVIYVRGPVMSARIGGLGGPNDLTTQVYGVGNNVFIEVPSEAVT